MLTSGRTSQRNLYQKSYCTNPWLRKFSKLTCLSTVALIFVGAMVKSTDSGLAVPDWPLSYGMLFPPMVGGVFYEHGHRMVAALVGAFMLCLAIWLGLKEPRRWVRHLGFWALGTVIVQGLLGGITVLYYLPTPISVMHGVLAQIFLVLTIILAYSQSIERRNREYQRSQTYGPYIKLTLLWIGVIFLQLILGAVMRHTESGLAIPDFPKMGGSWVPLFNQKMLAVINDWRFENNYDPVSFIQVLYHFLHRLGAVVIICLFCLLNYSGIRYYGSQKSVWATLLLLDFFVIVQIILGSLTVLTQKAPVVTSFHVVTGAAILGTSILLLLRIAPISYMKLKQQISH